MKVFCYENWALFSMVGAMQYKSHFRSIFACSGSLCMISPNCSGLQYRDSPQRSSAYRICTDPGIVVIVE